MAQATNPKIEELRTRIKTDPKSRLFFPLAEELRKMGGLDEAEQALRNGLEQHPTYLSAWVSLGRVLRERGDNGGVIEVLTKALQLDPGNVVAARILADTYLDMGQKVEAIKKYKLVHALLPQDQDVEELIEKLDRELNPPAAAIAPVAHPPQDPPASREETAPPQSTPAAQIATQSTPSEDLAFPPAPAEETAATAPTPPDFLAESMAHADFQPESQGSSFSGHYSKEASPAENPAPSRGHAPAVSPSESGFEGEAAESSEEPLSGESALSRPSQFDDTAPLGYDSHAFAIEQPAGMHIAGPEERASADDTVISRSDDASRWAAGTETSAQSEWGSDNRPRDDFAPAPDLASPWAVRPAADDAGRRADSPFSAQPASSQSVDPFPSVADEAVHTKAALHDRSEQAPAPAERVGDDVTNTITMGDLYARQGLVADAREIYTRVLERDPSNQSIRTKLEQLHQTSPQSASENASAKAARLQAWLSKVKRGSDGV